MVQLPLLHSPPAFCAYAGGPCDQDFSSLESHDGLFLFSSKPATIATTIEHAVALLQQRTASRWATWRDMDVSGRIIFCEICKSMRGAATVYADVTTLNFNLMFEIGFAIGLGLPVRPIRDTTYSVDKKLFDALGLLDTLGYQDFTTSEALSQAVITSGPGQPLTVPPKRTYRETPLYVLKGPIDTDGTVRLLSLLKKSRIGYRMYDPQETPRLSLHLARKNVTGSFGVFAHLLSPNREGATVHNALCALLCGMAVAEQKPVLMLQEEQTRQVIDYRDLVQSYDTPDQIEGLIREPLTQVVEHLQERPRAGVPPVLDVLSQVDLGDIAAENEIGGLREYFVQTGSFRQVRQGHAQLVVGRKGAGKTAMFYGLRRAVQRGRKVLVLDMKPEGHQFTRLREAVLEELSPGQQEYTIAAFWTYLLSAEIAHKILNSPSELHAAERDPERHRRYRALEDAYLGHGLASGDDLSQRLLRQIDRIQARFGAEGRVTSRSDLTELVYGGDIRTLNDAVGEYLVHEKDEVWLLLDNLDKSWATRGSTPEEMMLLRALLDATRQLQRQLEDRGVAFHPVVFVRTDIYEHLVAETPDRGKDTLVRLDWDDPEVFREIVRRRIATSTDLDGSFDDLWQRIGPQLIGIQDPFTYLLERTLMRPRDLLLFLGATIQVAIDRGHDRITPEDIEHAELGYSEDMLLALGFEIEDTHPGVSEALYGFQGGSPLLKRADVEAALRSAGVTEGGIGAAIDLLLWFGFLGARITDVGDDQYSYRVRYNVRRLLQAADSEKGWFVVHPAFRPALGIAA
jgi:hypothetical protein